MIKFSFASLVSVSLVFFTIGSAIAQNQVKTVSGRVNRVWEDGFQLQSRDRSITIDSYDVCGDNTARYVVVGDQLTVTGEFEGGEFDAFSITKVNGTTVCR